MESSTPVPASNNETTYAPCNRKKPVVFTTGFFLAPRAGLEPATTRLTAECSTIELPGNGRPRGLPPRTEKGFRHGPTLPPGLPSSTIGAGGLNDRVRNGNGCVPSARRTGKRNHLCKEHGRRFARMRSPHGACARASSVSDASASRAAGLGRSARCTPARLRSARSNSRIARSARLTGGFLHKKNGRLAAPVDGTAVLSDS